MAEEEQKKDYFPIYVGLTAIVLIGVIAAVKMSESEKFAPIKAQLQEEHTQMNIRVISQEDYEL